MNSKLFLVLVFNLSLGWAALAIPLNGGLVHGNPLLRTAVVVAAPAPSLVGAAVNGPVLVNTAGLLSTYRVSQGLGLHGLGLHTLGAIRAHAPYTGPVSAAVETLRTHQVVDVPTSQDIITPSTVIVEPNVLPVNIEFRSQSSPINPTQVHIAGPPGTVQETRSEEEPHILRHEVVKPIVQELRETIVPFRRITQEILPVQEEVHSLVARGQRNQVLAKEEVAIQAPAPVQIQAVAVKPEIVQVQQLPASSRTIVRAGLIGGARVLEVPDEPVPAESLSKRSGRKISAPVSEDAKDLSVNNRGPARPVKIA